MSRALDKATVAALQSGDQEAAYRAIANVLTPSSSTSARLELEFLGREYLPLPEDSPYYLRDGNAVAIPKLALVLAFVVARKLLQRLLSAASASGGDSEGEKLRATAVILMMDPEHLTAANTRKRILREHISNSKDAAAAAALVANELWLIDSFLTGHLHRHTKSPTLWNHRRWLLAFSSSQEKHTVTVDPFRDITGVVMVAAERHPRNYYAWDHARWLVGAAAATHETQNRLVLAVRDWCYRHHTDTSGWSFLLFLLTHAWARSERDETRPISPLLAETVAQVEQMATSLRWMGESVWVFLRTAVAYTELAEAATEATGDGKAKIAVSFTKFKETAMSLQSYVEPKSREHQVLQQAQDWCAAKIELK
ncbi:hypothetical protein F503_01509 [Ophiostoma piceae UAMH 11346]|uniref:Protein prenyltransferase n=1 Tax=Ophiostoma piceae (strain UAMH 11346) TaxID=1262450 RepID=S3CAC1_OPHP1|nr:hypothetical protein F503_01509 [Ophiostoma piceae UAMH 11346]